jgi:uncharacterized protein (TIRG00374 family)
MLKSVVKIAISGVLIAWLVHTTNSAELVHALGKANPAIVVLGALVLVGLSFVQTSRWLVVARALGIRLGFLDSWIVVQIGTFFNQVLPSSIGGDAARIWRLQRSGVPLSRALNSVVLDRLVALLGVVVIVLPGMPILFRWTGEPAKRIGIVVLVAAILGGLALLMVLDRAPSPRRLGETRAARAAKQLGRDAHKIFLSPRRIAAALVLSLFIHAGVSFVVWLIAQSVGVEISIGECLILVPVVVLFSMVPVSIAGWGIREGSMVVAFGLVGIGRAPALAVSVLFGLTLAVSGLPGAVLWLRSAQATAVREATTGG